MAIMPVVFFENQDGAGAITNLAALAAPPNNIYEVSGDDVRLPSRFNRIVGAYMGLDHTVEPRARVEAGSFKRQFGRQYLEVPFVNSGAEPGSPPLFNDWRNNPVPIEPDDVLNVETLNNPAAAADQYGILWLSDGQGNARVSPAGGRWMRVTTDASAVTANDWTLRTLPEANWDEVLEPGEYDVLGARAYSTSLIAFTIEDGVSVYHTPILGADAKADLPHPAFMPGEWGVLARFHTRKRPSIRLLCDLADNEAQVVDLYVKPVGGGAR